MCFCAQVDAVMTVLKVLEQLASYWAEICVMRGKKTTYPRLKCAKGTRILRLDK